jgi:short-subunit dehydrogenase
MAEEVVVITGASAGVGRATARAFGRRGASVGLLARGEEGLQAAAREIARAGGRAMAVPTDVADENQVEAAAARIEAELGPIGIWVNNAMTTVFSPFHKIPPAEYRRATEVTYLGFVWGTLAALKRMLPRDRGVIVQVGSALAYRSIPLQAPYCGAKHAIRGFTDSLRSELLHEGRNIHVTMVQLPAMNTPQFSWCRTRLPNHPQPVPPIFQPEVAAEAIVWAARHRRRELYVGRSTIGAIVANKFIPGLLDRYLARTGFASQQTSQPVPPDRPSNLFAPLPGDFGAHGIFDDRSSERAPAVWLSTHRGAVAGLAATGLAAAWLILAGRGRNRRAAGPVPQEYRHEHHRERLPAPASV